MKKKTDSKLPWIPLGLAVVVCLGLGFGLGQWLPLQGATSSLKGGAGPEQGKGAPGNKSKGPPVAVEVQIVSSQNRPDTVRTTGELRAASLVDLRTEVAGRLLWLAPEGQFVARGAVIARLEDREQRALVSKAQARATFLKSQYERTRDLEARGGASVADRESARAEWAMADADLALAQAQLQKMRIVAPFAGQLGLREMDAGAWLAAGSRLYRFRSTAPVVVDFTVPAQGAAGLKIGQGVMVKVGSTTGQGKIVAMDPWVDTLARQRKVRAQWQGSGAELFPGAVAEVAVPLVASAKGHTESPRGLWLPAEAVTLDQKGANVYVVRGGVAQLQSVQTARRTPVEVEIVQGLNLGDSVVVAGAMLLRPKAEVKIRAVRAAQSQDLAEALGAAQGSEAKTKVPSREPKQ